MPSSGAGGGTVEASLFPHVWVWHVWPMHQVVPVAELVKVKPALFPHSWQMTHIPMASLINLKSDEFSALLIDARGLWPIAR